jgi:Reverse transcriptase (RNA-dependent DNA polymerase)
MLGIPPHGKESVLRRIVALIVAEVVSVRLNLQYVDDILILASEEDKALQVFDFLSQHFRMMNLGEVKHFLGLQVTRNWNRKEISINQFLYIDKILQRFGMTDCIPADTPLDSSLPLHANMGTLLDDPTLYQEIIGSLTHLAVFSRSDISFSTVRLSQFMKSPTAPHLKAARHILRYLKGTKDLAITYYGDGDEEVSPHLSLTSSLSNDDNAPILGFSDASLANCLDTRKSQT